MGERPWSTVVLVDYQKTVVPFNKTLSPMFYHGIHMIMNNQGRQWFFMGKRPWSTMVLVDYQKPWCHLTKHGRPWLKEHGCMTMNNHGRPW